ncbi:MAG: phosphoglycerate kinase [Bradyrhizobium sp.]|uniref:phosphoglycerate kinase n=1 Tax=unclassified Bradyrhizobium TaxID=2631580 RepID=UPI000769E336|nr:phosphoglycerate kinase [Bradyrhizobium sp. CCH5-F6]
MTASLRTLDGIDVAGKRVVVRVDLNVPMKNGRVTDDLRIRHIAPTLAELADKRAIVIVLSHFERPRGRVIAEYSLAPLRPALERCLQRPVQFVATDWRNGPHRAAVAAAEPGDILLMDNTRFHPGEESNDPAFIRTLAGLGDIFVNDAFSAAHRAHASTEGIAHLLPSFAGRGMQAELSALDRALGSPLRPVGAIVGGAKVSTKITLLENLVKHVDDLIIGGGMANTFLHAQGISVGRSICEPQLGDLAERILRQAEKHSCNIVLPRDAVVAREFAANTEHQTVDIREVPEDAMILDIGPETVADIKELFGDLKTLLWNGPVGAFETEPFDRGTSALAKAAARWTLSGTLQTIAGGGDTVAALSAAGVSNSFTYVSTAGGAFLEWLEGRVLPGVNVLKTSKM